MINEIRYGMEKNMMKDRKNSKIKNNVFKAGIKRALATSLFCLVLSIGMITMADEKGKVLVDSAKIRASADTSSEQLGSVAKGGTVDIVSEVTGSDGKVWYQVYVDANTKGYIRADLVEKSGGASADTTTDTGSGNTSEPAATTATPVEAKKASVVSNNVRIRKGASTAHGVVATANRGMVVTVNGEATGADGKMWYQISFTYNSKEITGFIRSDLVTFDSLPADTAVTEITGTESETSTEMSTEPVTEAQPQEEQPQAEQNNTENNQNMILMNVEETPYVLPGFIAVKLNWNEQQINAYKNGNFYLFYAQMQTGEEGWYVFDSEKGIYQRYVYTSADAQIPDDAGVSGNATVIVIFVIIIVILLVVIAMMFLKLREYSAEYDYDDESDDSDDDIEELEELANVLDEQEEYVAPVNTQRRNSYQPNRDRAVNNQQPQRRPQQDMNGQPQRRPQQSRPQQMDRDRIPNQQPQRRPQQDMGGQPQRRPQVSQNGENLRRVENDGRMQNGRPYNGQNPNRRPNQDTQRRPQNAQLQKGHKAKSFMDAEDDDMDFIDI